MEPSVLCDVVAFVHQTGDANTHGALVSKLKSLGAAVTSRISKDTTHVIFQLKHRPGSNDAEDAELRTIYDRVGKVAAPAAMQGFPNCSLADQ
jgi:hypothetical protein